MLLTTSGRRIAATTALLLLFILGTGCGDTFRPVAVPVVGPPPDPKDFHFAIVVSQNAPGNPSSGMQIDVSGDTDVGIAKSGLGAVHGALTPNGGRVYVVNKANDTVSTFAPAPPCFFQPCTVTGTGPVTTITLPPGSAPIFAHSTEVATMYVANSNSTISAIGTTSNVVTSTISLPAQPIMLAETPDGKKLYSVNTNGSVSSINSVDKSVNPPIAGFSTPVWAVASLDSKDIFVLNQATGVVSVLDTFTDTVPTATVPAGAGANFMVLDRSLDRLYVTNPAANTLTIFDAGTTNTAISPPTAPTRIATVALPPGANPAMVTPLQDGSRAYTTSFSLGACASPTTDTCVSSQVTVIRTTDNTVTKTVDLGTVDLNTIYPPTTQGGPNVAVVACSTAPFPFSIASAIDSTKVFVANCFAGSTTVIATVDDTVVVPVTSPVSAYCPPLAPGQTQPCTPPPPNQPPLQPPPQNPMWVVAGP